MSTTVSEFDTGQYLPRAEALAILKGRLRNLGRGKGKYRDHRYRQQAIRQCEAAIREVEARDE